MNAKLKARNEALIKFLATARKAKCQLKTIDINGNECYCVVGAAYEVYRKRAKRGAWVPTSSVRRSFDFFDTHMDCRTGNIDAPFIREYYGWTDKFTDELMHKNDNTYRSLASLSEEIGDYVANH